MVYAPVYKDTYYTTTANTLAFNIEYEGEIIFTGKAYKMPSQDRIRININRICQSYLNQNIDTIFNGVASETNTQAIGVFYLRMGTTVLESYTFLYCYDYDFNWTGQTGVTLSQPICDVYGNGMKVLTTTINASRQVETIATTPTNTDNCVSYGLYYVNRRGGWDAFAIRGTTKKKETITQYLTDRSFDNNTREFEANRYLSEIKTSYELNTHYLSDEEADNLVTNLMSSNIVYLHDLTDGTIKPVIITDTAITLQTYQTNGKKLAQYKINVTESQSKIRR